MNPVTMQQYGQERMARARAQADIWREVQRAQNQGGQKNEAKSGWLDLIQERLFWNIKKLSGLLSPHFSADDN